MTEPLRRFLHRWSLGKVDVSLFLHKYVVAPASTLTMMDVQIVLSLPKVHKSNPCFRVEQLLHRLCSNQSLLPNKVG